MALITGRYPHSNGALNNNCALPGDQRTIGHHFKELGYRTGAIGKMHFIDEDQQHGFDDRIEHQEWNKTLSAELRTWHKEHADDKVRTTTGGVSPFKEEQTYEHFLAAKTVEWLEAHGREPFCLWFSMVAPHPPFFAPERLYNLYADKVTLPPQAPDDAPPVIEYIERARRAWVHHDEKTVKAMMAAYLGNITLVDDCMGRVLETLDRLRLAENTIVCYTSDHGDLQYEHRMFLKFVMYDGSSRIPIILRYPGRIGRGAVRQEVVEHVDLYPTFCDLAGVPIPKTAQGRSLAPLLQGPDPNWPNTAFSELGIQVMVRTAQYKCNFYEGKPLELYDMQKDPHEFYNLIGKPGAEQTIAEMTRMRDEWMTRTQPDLRSQVHPLKDRAGKKRKAK
jgi:choline-sulfatase